MTTMGFIPTKEQPNLILYSEDGYQVYRFGENADGSPKPKWLWTGKVEDKPQHMIAAVGLVQGIANLLRGAVRSFVAWRVAKAEEAAVQALLKNYRPNSELGRLAKDVVDKGGLERMTAIEREAAARFYEQQAAKVVGKYAEAARRLNLARARYLREGGPVPPGKIRGFK